MTLLFDPTSPAQHQGATAFVLPGGQYPPRCAHIQYPGPVSLSSASKESQGRVCRITT